MGWNSLYITRHFRLISHIEEINDNYLKSRTQVLSYVKFTRFCLVVDGGAAESVFANDGLGAISNPPPLLPPTKPRLLYWGNNNGLGHKTPPLAIRLKAFLIALIL
jgi:hypothetical protein